MIGGAALREFGCGGRYVLSGLALITRPGIRRYVLIPLSVNLCLFAAAIALGVQQLAGFIDRLAAQWAWAEWLALLLWPLFMIIVLGLAFFCFALLANLLAAPFNGLLAEAVAAYLQPPINRPANNPAGPGQLPARLVCTIKQALCSETAKLRYFAARALPLSLLFFIPVLGQTAAPGIWLLFAVWMLSLQYLDYPLGNQGKGFTEIRQMAAARKPLIMGFGSAVMALTAVPGLNSIAMPVAVAAATKLALEKLTCKTVA